MSYENFQLAVKSTIDYRTKQLANSLSLPFLDLDGSEFNNDTFESDQPALCWEFSSMTEDPMDPMWTVSFDLGAMLLLDPSQYISLNYVGKLMDSVKVGTRIPILNYSGVNQPSTVEGVLTVVAAGTVPQQSDRITGFRFISVLCRASRWIA